MKIQVVVVRSNKLEKGTVVHETTRRSKNAWEGWSPVQVREDNTIFIPDELKGGEFLTIFDGEIPPEWKEEFEGVTIH